MPTRLPRPTFAQPDLAQPDLAQSNLGKPAVNSPVTIAYLINTYPRASHSFIRREIQAVERQGLGVHRFAMRTDRAALKDAADLEEDGRTEHVLALPKLALLRSALALLAARPALALAALALALRLGRRANARLIHLVYLVEAAHVAARCRTLGIAHLHAHFGTNSTTVALLVSALGGPGFSFTTHGPEEFDAPLALSLGDKVAASRFAVAISSFGRSQLCRWTPPAQWDRIKVVHCGIEPARFDAPAPLPDGGPHLVAIGRLSAQKGFGLLIDAVAEAVQTLPDLRLVLVGDGDLRDQITAAITARSLPGNIHLAGWQDEAGVRDALARAQALILPSFAEGLPVVVMEAMAAARPVIATAIAGVPELVTPDTGWLVPAGDAGALAAAIRAMAATPAKGLTTMGQAARTRVLARHDVDTEAAKLVALFRQAIEGTAK